MNIPSFSKAGGWFEPGGNMCEANAYLVKGGREELVLEDVSILRSEKDELFLQNLFGDQKKIKARIKEMNLIDHKIILEEL